MRFATRAFCTTVGATMLALGPCVTASVAQDTIPHAESCTQGGWGFRYGRQLHFGTTNTCHKSVTIWFMRKTGELVRNDVSPGGTFDTGLPKSSFVGKGWVAATCLAGFRPRPAVAMAHWDDILHSRYVCAQANTDDGKFGTSGRKLPHVSSSTASVGDGRGANANAAPVGHSSTAVRTDTVENKLEAVGDELPRGVYALDDALDFNVLDSVYYDAAQDQLSLVGHFDPRFQGPRVPYLEYLATLLENPKPEFTLTWTPDSKRRIDALFSRRLSKQQGESITHQWGTLFDRNHNLTRAGYYLLPALGISPIRNNQAPGSLGLTVKTANVPGILQVTAVRPGSPAEAAGLKVGYLIQSLQGEPVLTPSEFYRIVRQSGAGWALNIGYVGVVNGRMVQATAIAILAADANGDIWDHATRYDVIKALYLANGDLHAAAVIDVVGIWDRLAKPGQSPQLSNALIQILIDSLGVRSAAEADRQAVQRHSMTLNAAKYDVMLKVSRAFDSTFHFIGNPVAQAYENSVRMTHNVDNLTPATNVMDRLLVGKIGALLDPIFQRRSGVQIPPELVEDQFHVHPEMQPEYLGVPGDSLLARAMYAGDYLCKRLMNRPDLKRTISGYQTEFEFEQTHPAFRHTTGNYRLWISVDKMDTPQSPDGKILAFRNVKMRFNIREQTDSGRDIPNRPGSYEELLTSLWDKFEQEYPTLHQLREAAKLAAAANWILQHNRSASLPTAGRAHWHGPTTVPGLVFIELTPDAARGMYKTHETIIAEGGVSLVPFPRENVNNPNADGQATANPFPYDSSVVDLTGLGEPVGAASGETPLAPALFSHQQQDSLASRIFHEKIIVPEPHPSAWVTDFTKGNRTLSAISVALSQLKQGSPVDAEASIEQRRKLEQVRLVAIHLAQVERALNLLNETNSENVRQFQQLQEEITAQRDAFYEHMFDFSLDNMLEARFQLNEHPDIAEAGNIAYDTGENIDYLEKLEGSLRTGQVPVAMLEAGTATIKRFSEGLARISRDLGATPAATYFDTVTEAKRFTDVLAMEGEVAQLEFVTDVKVEKLESSSDAAARARKALLPLQRELSDQLDALCNDPQLKGLTVNGNTGGNR